MAVMMRLVWMAVVAVPLAACAQPVDEGGGLGQSAAFGEREVLGVIEHGDLTEASGLVASRQQPGVLWAHNDSGDGPRLFAFDRAGRHLRTVTLDGAPANDWEDLALGPGPEAGVDYLYVGDVGDNTAQRADTYVIRVAEPPVDSDAPSADTTVAADVFAIRYPDGPRDAEVLLVDGPQQMLYVISKEATPRIYGAGLELSAGTDPIVLELVGELPMPLPDSASAFGHVPTGGDLSADGEELMVKTYRYVYRWARPDGGSVFEAEPELVPYVFEPQGEALAVTPDGYYTVSEEPGGIPAVLAFYPRSSSAE